MTTAAALASALSGLQNLSYVQAASLTVITFDYLLSFESEVKYVWLAPWTGPKIIFFINRYLPFIDVSAGMVETGHFATYDTHTCSQLFTFIQWIITIGITAGNMLLLLRTWVIYGKTVSCGIVLGVGALSTTLFLIIGGVYNSNIVFGSIPGIAPCIPTAPTDWDLRRLGVFSGVGMVINDTMIFLLTLIKGFDHLRHKNEALLSVLYTDALLYSSLVLALSLTNLVFAFYILWPCLASTTSGVGQSSTWRIDYDPTRGYP